jgi:hypothetical protein
MGTQESRLVGAKSVEHGLEELCIFLANYILEPKQIASDPIRYQGQGELFVRKETRIKVVPRVLSSFRDGENFSF